ncbi:Aspartate aminotransferase, cytoplasmic [Physocladia obscura]|uniref:aspartate transaminase n=1 Tax=Physocladia obscura TaxID=109957 RepID=A0AAD5XIR0_9FUNG|nr:Aspartate aminotransferase, cytoplasmic [Physocladia obscura]
MVHPTASASPIRSSQTKLTTKKFKETNKSRKRSASIAGSLSKRRPQTNYLNLSLQPEDPIFKLLGECEADQVVDKINLSVGAYRDSSGKPWVLPVVKKAKAILLNDPSASHEYSPLEGNKCFNEHAVKLVLGVNSIAITEKRYSTVQAVSGTGANRLAAEFLAKFKPATVYISNPTWGNHSKIFTAAGLSVLEYEYWNPKMRSLNYEVLLDTLNEAPIGSIFVLHACAHNPTGIDPTQAQWKKIAAIMKSKAQFPFFDCAYQGFASGDLDKDAWAVRHFVEQGFDMLIAQSFSKNFGLYSERVGCLTGIFSSTELAKKAKSQFCALIRCSISNAPGFGAKIVEIVLSDEKMHAEWVANLKTMASRISLMREKLVDNLRQLQTPGDWSHITSQVGMFSYTGLNTVQVAAIKGKFHVYMTDEGRVSMAGLNEGNIASDDLGIKKI